MGIVKEEATPNGDNLLASVSLLQKFDQLREKNISQHIALPQSSGKSSVLQSLTRIPFPRDAELCTRYATQITSRRDDEEYVDISIIPGPAATQEHKDKLAAFHTVLDDSSNFAVEFTAVIAEANEAMGIRLKASEQGGSMFSDDVLKIEMCGPDKDYLTVIDVPGIFRNVTDGVTTKEDMALVKTMVTKYIRNSRTIILAIIPGNVDIGVQEILSLAKEHDPAGERTIGVLTKPDLISEEGLVSSVCSLIRGKKNPLALGYYLIKNQGAKDTGEISHQQLDAFFQRAPWNDLPSERVGVKALKTSLGRLLASITKREFPGFRAEINTQLCECRAELASLGSPRQTERQQLLFVTAIAEKFQSLVRAAISGKYDDPFFERKAAKLTTYIANLSEVFADVHDKVGAVRRFHDIEATQTRTIYPITPAGTPHSQSEVSKRSTWKPVDVAKQHKILQDIIKQQDSELDDLIEPTYFENFKTPADGIMQWIEEHYLASRGLDLGAVHNDIIACAFQEQAKNWGEIAKTYISCAIRVIHAFCKAAFKHACRDQQVREALWARLSDEILDRYQLGLEKCEYLWALERECSPYTLNVEYTRRMKAFTCQRTRQVLDDGVDVELTIDQVTESFMKKGNLEQVKETIHDTLRSYYSIAKDRFTDTVFQQAVHDCLLTGPDSPLKVFTQQWVIGLEPQALEDIAGESEATKARRDALERKAKDLEEAVRILR
ncbi:hypothetical protein KEM52_003246 [Ascosphaera acerosa]|nr:hypothetical protein KEM52_003246 [Ascosphaera acerosa]